MQSEADILERARSLCSEGCFAVALQHRRLRSKEPEDEVFILRWWTDLQFLIVSLRRLRRSALTAAHVRARMPLHGTKNLFPAFNCKLEAGMEPSIAG